MEKASLTVEGHDEAQPASATPDATSAATVSRDTVPPPAGNRAARWRDRLPEEGICSGIRFAVAGGMPGRVRRAALFSKLTTGSGKRRLSALVTSIGLINVFNRVNAATRQIGGEWIAHLPFVKNV
jgi:hypothetical protein